MEERAVDDDVITVPAVLLVTGTTIYKTVIGGTNTVLVAQPLDTSKIEAHLKTSSEQPDAGDPPDKP